jgi:hypothetical protein
VVTKADRILSQSKRVHIPAHGNIEVYRRKRWHRGKLLFATRLDAEGHPLAMQRLPPASWISKTSSASL